MKPTKGTRLPDSVRTAQNVYQALSILQRRGFADIDLASIEAYRDVADKAKLDRLIVDTPTVEDLLAKIARTDSDIRRAVTPKPSKTNSPGCSRPERPTFVQPIAPFPGAIARVREIRALELLLTKRTKNNVLLCGAAGSGKTALVEALATLRPHLGPFWRVDVGALVGGTPHRGDLEQRLAELFDFVTNSESTIFIDEIHALARMGVAEGAISALDVMKPQLVHPEFRIIGATTLGEVRFIIADPAFHRRFSVLRIPELTTSQLQSIYDGYVERSELLGPLKQSFASILSFIDTLTIPASRVDTLLDFLEHVEAYRTTNPDAPIDSEELIGVAGSSYNEFRYLPEDAGTYPIGGEI